MDEIFKKSKDEIVRLVHEGVRSFEPNRTMCLATDWSKVGLGFTLQQKHCSCPPPSKPTCGEGHWRLIYAGSRFTSSAESRYAPVEGESLAIVHRLKSCRMFVLGCPDLIIAVDHKPLVKIFNDRQLDTIDNPRLRALKEKTLMYRFSIIEIPGKANNTPDAASRNPAKADDRSTELEESINAATTSFATQPAGPIPGASLQDIQNAASMDEECTALTSQINQGFPNARNALSESLRPYWPMREGLYTIDGVPFNGKKYSSPKSSDKES